MGRLPSDMTWKQRVDWCVEYAFKSDLGYPKERKSGDKQTKQNLAEHIGVSKNWFGTLETRTKTDPDASRDYETCKLIAHYLKIDLEWLYEGHGQPQRGAYEGLSRAQQEAVKEISLSQFTTATRFRVYDAILERFRTLRRTHGNAGRPVWIAEAEDIIRQYELAENIARNGT